MTTDAFMRQLEALGAEYRSSLPGKLAAIESLWRDLAGGTAGTAGLGTLERELHGIAGTAKTLGVPGVSEAAAAAEAFLEPFSRRRKFPDAGERAEFERLLGALRRAAS